MNAMPFKTSGPLTGDHAEVYIERFVEQESEHADKKGTVEQKAMGHLLAMDYLLIIEPRQQGKTSLLNYLMRHPASSNMIFASVDITTLDCSTEESWYRTLCTRLLSCLKGLIPSDQHPDIPKNGAGWHDFLKGLARYAKDSQKRVVIALDEVGAASFPGVTTFFSVLRALFNSRQASPEFAHLTFLLVGVFHPQDLIKNESVSPFNIAEHLHLPDFNLEQVRQLVGKGSCPEDKIADLAERIHCWTSGQPYLTQLLCSYLGPDATPEQVDSGVDRLRRNDRIHLPPLLRRVRQNKELCDYVDLVLRGEPIKFYPAENRSQAQLELLGVLKADKDGYCTIRNRIYSQALCSGERIVLPNSSQERERESKTVTWLHLSDFHVGKDRYGQRRLFGSILEHVRHRVQNSTGPDMVFVTGDIANRGKADEYTQFIDEFYKPLAEAVGDDCAGRIFLVPGNHDVDRTKARATVSYKALDLEPELLDPTKVGLEARAFLPRFQAFVEADQSKRKDGPHWLRSAEGALVCSLDIGQIGILGVNTAWLSRSDEDEKQLRVGKDIVAEGLEKIRHCDVRIVLGHHPLAWLADGESAAIRALFGRHRVIYLHGHMHKGHSSHKEGAGHPFLTLQAGACFQAREDERWVNRLLWCTLNLEARELGLEPFYWSRDYQEWVIDAGAFPKRYQQPDVVRWVLNVPPSVDEL